MPMMERFEKTMQKECQQPFETIKELASDVQRFKRKFMTET